MRLILCAYEQAGCDVLAQTAERADISDIFVYTHESPGFVPDVRKAARRLGVESTTSRISLGNLPFEPDVISSVYYRYIIDGQVIAACQGRIFNAHPSLLPRHRGCSSVPWAIIEGDTETGVTYHYIDAAIDTGRIISQTVVPIGATDTQLSVYQAAMNVASEQWPAALDAVIAGEPGRVQAGTACYHARGAPYGGEIDPGWPIPVVERFIRAMTFPPRPYAQFRGREITTLDDYIQLKALELPDSTDSPSI